MALLVALSFAFVPSAHAADWSGGGYDTYDYDYGGGYDTYDYDYGGGYGSGGGFGGGGFSFGGGGFSIPMNYGGGGGGGYTYSSVYAPTNTNTCTAFNSCNTTYDDHSIFNAPTTIVTNTTTAAPQPVVYAQQPYYPPQQPIAYNRPAPYVTLAAVPYTGLELGPVGTALYWGFLVLWCLIAAYLIAVKKVQNKVAAWFTGSTIAPAHTAHAPVAHVAYAAPKAAPVSSAQFAGIDPFIQSQINRTN